MTSKLGATDVSFFKTFPFFWERNSMLFIAEIKAICSERSLAIGMGMWRRGNGMEREVGYDWFLCLRRVLEEHTARRDGDF